MKNKVHMLLNKTLQGNLMLLNRFFMFIYIVLTRPKSIYIYY